MRESTEGGAKAARRPSVVASSSSVSPAGASGGAPTVAGFLPPSAYSPLVPLWLAHDASCGSPEHPLTHPPANHRSERSTGGADSPFELDGQKSSSEE